MTLADNLLRLVEAEEMRRDFKVFIRQAWPMIEPAPFVDGWCLHALADHLAALTTGHIRFLLINIPPRHTKSSTASVLWPVWDWVHKPEDRFLVASYNLDLAIRDNGKKKALIETPWFQDYFGTDVRISVPGNMVVESVRDFTLSEGQNAKRFFANDKMGYQLACSVGSSATGQGGSVLVIDDAHAASEAYSDADRLTALRWFMETWSNRMNNPKLDRMLVVGQRIHENDVPGHILRERKDWVHLNLPAEYDPKRKCITNIWEDPRKKEGELLWPERFPQETLERYKRDLGSMGYAAQYQQLPVPAGGGNFKKLWFRYFTQDDMFYHLQLPQGKKSIPKSKCWKFSTVDLATSLKQSADYTVLHTYAVTPYNDLLLLEQERDHMDGPVQIRAIRLHYMRFEPDYMKIETAGFQLSAVQQLRNTPTQTHDYFVDAIGDPVYFDREILGGFPQMDAYLLRDETHVSNPYVHVGAYYVVRVLGDVTYFHDLMRQQNYCTVVGPVPWDTSAVSVPIREYRPVGDKVSRANVASVHMEGEHVFFQEGAPYLVDIETELLAFPKGSHDDIVDCLSSAADEVMHARGPLADEDEYPIIREKSIEQSLLTPVPPLSTERHIEAIDPFVWIDEKFDKRHGLYRH